MWRAEHVELGTPAAVKLIDPRIAGTGEALLRFKREAQAAATLRSPHVVQILDYGVDEGTPYIGIELMEGVSLAQRLAAEGAWLPEVTANILTHVARTLTKAHEMGIVHRDLKPDNIFLVRNDDEELAKVLDFGIAKRTRDGLASTEPPLASEETGSLHASESAESPIMAATPATPEVAPAKDGTVAPPVHRTTKRVPIAAAPRGRAASLAPRPVTAPPAPPPAPPLLPASHPSPRPETASTRSWGSDQPSVHVIAAAPSDTGHTYDDPSRGVASRSSHRSGSG